jgi:septum site-determining protein MinD
MTANLAVLIARAGHRVAVIDTDIQSPGVHVLFNLDSGAMNKSLNDYLWGRCPIEEAAYDVTDRCFSDGQQRPERSKMFLIPSSLNTGEIARVLREGYDVALLNDGFRELIRQLELDYLLIDTHPGVNEETLLSIAVSDILVLLMRPDNQDFQGTAVTVELSRRLEVPQMFLVVNKVPPGMDLDSLRQQIEAHYKVDVAAMLPLNAEIARLASGGIFATRYPEHPFSQELQRVVRRVLE